MYRNNKVPGPGNYNIVDLFGESTPKFTIKARTPFLNAESVDKLKVKFPGPGKYNLPEHITRPDTV